MKSYVAFGYVKPEVGGQLINAQRFNVATGKTELITTSTIKSVKLMLSQVWLVKTENSTYLYICRKIADKRKPEGYTLIDNLLDYGVVLGCTDRVPRSKGGCVPLTVMVGVPNEAIRRINVKPTDVARVRGNRDVYYLDTADKLYVALVTR